MNKFPFTAEGAAAMVAALYEMSDAALNLEADAAATDFASWLLTKFSFETSQANYLGGMSTTLLSYMGAQVGMSLRHRLSLTLVKPLQRGNSDTKLIETKSKIDTSGDENGGESATGSVIVEISY